MNPEESKVVGTTVDGVEVILEYLDDGYCYVLNAGDFDEVLGSGETRLEALTDAQVSLY